MSQLDIPTLVDWLGPEGAVAGLDKSDLSNADLMMIARREGIEVEPKASRRQLTIELVMARIERVEKSIEQLVELSREELKRYFSDKMVSNAEMLDLLRKLEIAPSRKIRGRLIDFAANEISDLGMYSRVAKGRAARDTSGEPKDAPIPKRKS